MASSDNEPFKWTHELERRLLRCMEGIRPVGIRRHFGMIAIWERFKQNIGRHVSFKEVDDKIGEYYNLDAASRREKPFVFPVVDFSLPEDEFPEVAAFKQALRSRTYSVSESTPLTEPELNPIVLVERLDKKTLKKYGLSP